MQRECPHLFLLGLTLMVLFLILLWMFYTLGVSTLCLLFRWSFHMFPQYPVKRQRSWFPFWIVYISGMKTITELIWAYGLSYYDLSTMSIENVDRDEHTCKLRSTTLKREWVWETVKSFNKPLIECILTQIYLTVGLAWCTNSPLADKGHSALKHYVTLKD